MFGYNKVICSQSLILSGNDLIIKSLRVKGCNMETSRCPLDSFTKAKYYRLYFYYPISFPVIFAAWSKQVTEI